MVVAQEACAKVIIPSWTMTVLQNPEHGCWVTTS